MSNADKDLEHSALVMKIVGWGLFLFLPGVFVYSAGIVWGSLPPGFPIFCGAHPPSPYAGLHPYLLMIVGIYVSYSILLIRGAKDPKANAALFDFGILANLVHAGIMLPQALIYPGEIAHLWTDVPVLLMVSLVLWIFYPGRVAPEYRSVS